MNNKYFHVEQCKSFYDFIKRINSYYAESTAFLTHDTSITYSDFCAMVFKCASFLTKYKRQFIIIDVDDTIFFSVVYFATIISGNIAFLVPKSYCEDWGINNYFTINYDSLQQILNTQSIIAQYEECNPYDVCTIVCSSGTTSVKKGVMLSQKNILSSMIGGMKQFLYKQGDIFLNVLPYTHMFGIVADLLAPLYSGGTICQPKSKLSFFSDLNFYKPTNLNLPPALISSIVCVLKETKNFNVATGGNLKKILCAGAYYNEELGISLTHYGVNIYVAYGFSLPKVNAVQ